MFMTMGLWQANHDSRLRPDLERLLGSLELH
jgi:hypothetical protein